MVQDIFKNRHTYIGASEAAAVLGVSLYKSPVEVWAEKTQLIERPKVDSIAADLGIELEDYVARRYMRETGRKVQKVSEPYTHGKYPFLKAHIDRKIVGEKGIVQCKTCSAWKSKDWEGEDIPADYIIQEYHELACSDYEYADVAVLIGNQDFKIKRITRDEAVINDIIQKEVSFWNNFVIPKVMPTMIKPKDGDILYKLFPVAKVGEIIELSDVVNAQLESLDALKQDYAVVGKEISRAKNKLKALIKSNEIGTTGTWEIFWRNVVKKPYEVKEQKFRQLTYRKIKREGG